MGFVLSKKDLLSNEEVNKVDVYFNLDEINTGEPKITDVDKKIAQIKKLKNIDYEVGRIQIRYSAFSRKQNGLHNLPLCSGACTGIPFILQCKPCNK